MEKGEREGEKDVVDDEGRERITAYFLRVHKTFPLCFSSTRGMFSLLLESARETLGRLKKISFRES